MRYFGQGDVLRNATLEFAEGIRVHIESRFEQCSIALGRGAELTVGKQGVLAHCRIEGAGNITLHGKWRILRSEQAPIGLAAILHLELPTGNSAQFRGEPGWALWPVIA